uniref:Nudix hydrolase domain-containing protein n=1 Tax=Globodera rostochiensis TaxID=31243 RepID=A0A914GTP0_GLORO
MRDANTDRSPADTAIREAYEEIGLPPAFVRVVGALRPVTASRYNIRIIPIVALMSDRRLREFRPFYSSEFPSDFSPQQNFVVFGITAALCFVAAVAILRRLPKFVAGDNEQKIAAKLLTKMFDQLICANLSPFESANGRPAKLGTSKL